MSEEGGFGKREGAKLGERPIRGQRLKLIGAPVRFLAVARQSACSGVAGAGAACGK
jgi:hypothetical protein